MSQSKRRNYLIDKPFQLGFIVKYLVVILVTVLFCFGVTAVYFYYDNLFGENRVNETVLIKYHKPLRTVDGINISEKGMNLYNLESRAVTVYKATDGTYKAYNQNAGRYTPSVYKNDAYQAGETISLTDSEVKELKIVWGPFEKSTQRFFIVIYPLLWTCFAILIIISIYSLFFSHRMAGPIYRMRVSLDRMLAGDLDFKIRVRRNDFFRNIVEKLEQLRIKFKSDAPMKDDNK